MTSLGTETHSDSLAYPTCLSFWSHAPKPAIDWLTYQLPCHNADLGIMWFGQYLFLDLINFLSVPSNIMVMCPWESMHCFLLLFYVHKWALKGWNMNNEINYLFPWSLLDSGSLKINFQIWNGTFSYVIFYSTKEVFYYIYIHTIFWNYSIAMQRL